MKDTTYKSFVTELIFALLYGLLELNLMHLSF